MSIVIAIVLFVLASWIEGLRSPRPPIDRAPTPVVERPGGDDAPMRDDITLPSCREAEQDVRDKVEASQSCDADADCTIFDYGYPIECLTSVAQSEISALRLVYRTYEQSCSFRVFYDCPSAPLERHPVCRNNRCAVELRTVEMLKDQTLDHIGIPPKRDPGTEPQG